MMGCTRKTRGGVVDAPSPNLCSAAYRGYGLGPSSLMPSATMPAMYRELPEGSLARAIESAFSEIQHTHRLARLVRDTPRRDSLNFDA